MPQRCKILIASHAWYGDTIGGAFRLASELAVALVKAGHDVHYVCCDTRKDRFDKSSDSMGVVVHRYPPPSQWLPGFLKLRHHLRATMRLVGELQKVNPFDVASLHSPLQGWGALRSLRNSGAIANYTVHSPFDDEVAGNGGGRPSLLSQLIVWKARQIDRENCRLADVVQCLSRFTLSVLKERHTDAILDKGVVVPGWVDLELFRPVEARSSVRSTLSDPWICDVPLFFTLRRLENRMGLETLIEASRILAERGLQFRTLIGGSGSLGETLRQQIEVSRLGKHVFMLGRLPEEQLADCYAAADCFVLPTKSLECFGLIVLEAFACNTPVIASNVAAIPELAERQGRDWMFEPGDGEQLADRMQAFIEQRLKPTVDLRAVAMEYDKPRVLAEWERVLVGSRQ